MEIGKQHLFYHSVALVSPRVVSVIKSASCMTLGMAMLVCWLVNRVGIDCIISTTVGWIAMTFGTIIYGALTKHPKKIW